jgi:riboflavin synthase
MFTGLIEEIGILDKIEPITDGRRIKISAVKIIEDIKVNDSIAVNGVCLTVVKIDKNSFWTEAVGETLKKTTINKLNQNCKLNLERALRLTDRLGGHLVQGHVNGIGKIKKINRIGDNYYLEVQIPEYLEKYVIKEGSIAIDGISLTIANLQGNLAGLSIIPHTWQNTNLQFNRVSEEVNIEVDIVAKYVEKLLGMKGNEKNLLSESMLKNMGY